MKSIRSSIVVAVALLAGCGPLYGGKAEKLKTPASRKRPPEAELVIPWVTECRGDFHADAKGLKRQVSLGQTKAATATSKFATVPGLPTPDAKMTAIIAAINDYKGALVADPYNADATRGLAVAYATVWHKGCALQLLERLAALAANADYQADAERNMDAAQSDPAFAKFRTEVDTALGR